MDLKFEVQTMLRNSPLLLETAWRWRKPLGIMQRHPMRRVAEPDDAVVIDGYPRSANTFACDAFTVAQGHSLEHAVARGYPVKMGNHFHSPAQFALARKYGVPAMLVLREPVAAALSWVVFTEGKLTASDALRHYVHFHEPLVRIADAFAVAPFEEVTRDFGKSIARLNAKFGTQFRLFDHSDETQQAIFAEMETRLRNREKARGEELKLRRNFPHEQKKEMSRRFAADFEAPQVADLRRKAGALYAALMTSV